MNRAGAEKERERGKEEDEEEEEEEEAKAASDTDIQDTYIQDTYIQARTFRHGHYLHESSPHLPPSTKLLPPIKGLKGSEKTWGEMLSAICPTCKNTKIMHSSLSARLMEHLSKFQLDMDKPQNDMNNDIL